jgi:hypothetical protein
MQSTFPTYLISIDYVKSTETMNSLCEKHHGYVHPASPEVTFLMEDHHILLAAVY